LKWETFQRLCKSKKRKNLYLGPIDKPNILVEKGWELNWDPKGYEKLKNYVFLGCCWDLDTIDTS
jgi:hypothetical protein